MERINRLVGKHELRERFETLDFSQNQRAGKLRSLANGRFFKIEPQPYPGQRAKTKSRNKRRPDPLLLYSFERVASPNRPVARFARAIFRNREPRNGLNRNQLPD